jgi:hypothetical protein
MKKLLLLPLFIASFLNSNSQVYNAGTIFPGYSDIVPDSLFNYTIVPFSLETIPLNMFVDASDDLELRASGAVSPGGSAAYMNVIAMNPNVSIRFGRYDSVYVPSSSIWNITKVAKPLAAGDPIDPPGAIWDNTMQYLSDHSSSGGGTKNVNDWLGAEKYIGLKYQSGSTTAYGWIRFQQITEDSAYVKDYSFTPSVVGLREKEKKQVLFYPNPINDCFYFDKDVVDLIEISKLKLMDLYGKEISFTLETTDNSMKVHPDQDLPDGCYVLQYLSEENNFSAKLVKIKQ